jgi:hypothetical protein
MFIDANAITVIIEKYEELVRNGQIFVHPNAIIKDLEGLIDTEAVRQETMMDKMAEDYEAEEYGKYERESAAAEKQISMQDWPGGV